MKKLTGIPMAFAAALLSSGLSLADQPATGG
jgi:hypothetical protein